MKNLLYLTLLTLVACSTNPQKPFLMGTLYFQKSAEVKALYLQGYNVGTLHLKNHLRKRSSKNKKQCVILDIDETVLDNSPYQGYLYDHSENYTSKSWHEWIKMEKARALPGVKSFLDYAHSQGVGIYLVSNRKAILKKETYNNLIKVKLPIKEDHLLLRTKERSKDARRALVQSKCHVALYFGDNLSDFPGGFNRKDKERHTAVEKYQRKMGTKFIIFPNPMYGDWLDALNYDFTPKGY